MLQFLQEHLNVQPNDMIHTVWTTSQNLKCKIGFQLVRTYTKWTAPNNYKWPTTNCKNQMVGNQTVEMAEMVYPKGMTAKRQVDDEKVCQKGKHAEIA